MKVISLPMFRSLVFGSTAIIELVEVYILDADQDEPDYAFALTDRAVEFGGRTYLPSGFHRPQIRESLQDAMSETSIVLPDVGRSLAILMETAELSGSRVVIRRTTEARRAAGESVVRYEGKIASVTVQGATVSLGLVGMVSDLSGQRVVPARSYIVTCENRFGDDNCTFDVPSFTVACSVGPGSNRLRLMADAITAQQSARGWNPSAVRFRSGINSGQQRPVATVRAGMAVLRKPFYTSPAEGDAFDLIRQCPKTAAACAGDFENYPNFAGHEYGPKDPRRIVRNNPLRI